MRVWGGTGLFLSRIFEPGVARRCGHHRTACRNFWTGTSLFLALFGLAACEPSAESGSALGQLRLSGVLGDTDLTGYSRARDVIEFRFPRDHLAHDTFRSEWWYFTFMLRDATGAEFGAQFTVFRQALQPTPVSENPWQTNQVYLGHFAITDVAAGEHRAYERVARGHPALAGVREEPFQLTLDGWLLEALAGRPGWHLRADSAGDALDVTITPEKPIVLHGEGGLSAKGPGNASYYYSISRLSVTGSLRAGGVEHQVTGSAWFDREWSTSVLSGDQIGWDWFALQFADGRDLMVFQLRRRDGRRDSYDQGLWVAPDGRSRSLRSEDFSLEPVAYWHDADGVGWPIQWRLQTAAGSWRIRAALADQRMATTLVYWEGLIDIYDMANRRVGRGYMELTGYGDDG